MNAEFCNVAIKAVAAALPSTSMTMEAFEARFGTPEVKRIMAGTGIKAVRIAEDLSTGDLCAAAALSLISASGLTPSAIDGLVVITQTPDRLMPGTGALLQRFLGLPEDVAVFDINSGCSGYIYGLYQAAMMVASGGCDKVLLLTGDVITKLLHGKDRHVRMVFGDAATATLVERGNDRFSASIESYGDGGEHLGTEAHYSSGDCTLRGGHLHMNGAEVMGFAVSKVPKFIDAFLDRQGLSKEQVPLFVMHQANQLMLTYLRRQMGLDATRLPISVATVGNTGPSSIPLFLAMTQASGLDRRSLERVLLCGFGVGLSVGATLADLRETTFIAPVDVTEPMLASSLPQASATANPLRREFFA